MSERIRPLRMLRRLLFPVLGAAWLFGWLVRDVNAWTLWPFFIPAPLIAGWGLLSLILRGRRVGRARRTMTAGLTALALLKIAVFDTRWGAGPPPPEGALRVVHWNVAHAPFGYVPLLKTLAADRPDLVILVETKVSQDIPFFAQRELGLPHAFQDQGMVILSRFPFEPKGTLPVANARAWWAQVETPHGPLRVVTVDIHSHPTLNRRQAAEPLAAWVDTHAHDAPLLVVGDFNTPRDARALQPLRTHLRHAYETAGRGWPYTWPLPVPMYSIDHAWISDHLSAHDYRLRKSSLSDHLRQVFQLSFRKEATP